MKGQPDPLDNSLEPHNAFVADGVNQYIDWAHKNKFGIIDVNVPQYITHPEVCQPPHNYEKQILILVYRTRTPSSRGLRN